MHKMIHVILFLTGFVFLGPRDSTSFLSRWKPQLLADQIVITQTSLAMYTNTRIRLEAKECVGAFCSLDGMFSISEKDEIMLVTSYLTREGNELAFCRDFKEWLNKNNMNATFDGSLLNEDQRQFWDISEFEP